MAFNTNNPLGSTDPRDLSDNAENLDRFANGADPAYNDRLSKSRKSLAGMESDFASDQASRATTFANFLASSGYEFLGEYAGGIEVTEYNQIIRESGEFWRPTASTSLPYTTTGAGMPESGAFVAVGDAALRQEIGSGIFRADSLANLESTNGRFDGDAARLVSGTGRDGDFRWDSSDLSATLVLASATSDSVDDTTDTINDADHPFSDGDGVITQTTVNGLTAQTVYWVVNSTSGSYQLSATFGGGAVDLTGTTNVTVDHLFDPWQGIWVTPSSDNTGASGAWVRQFGQSVMIFPTIKAGWFGPVADGVTDDYPRLQSALNITASVGGWFEWMNGEHLVNSTLRATTSGNKPFKISGVSQYGSSLKAGPNLESADKPDMSGGLYSIALDYNPVLAINVTTGVTLEDFQIDGGDFDVYGLYVNESFFFDHTRIRVKSCNQRPFTFVRVQVGTFESMQSIINGQGASPNGTTLFYDCTSLTLTSPSMQSIGSGRYSMEFFQPNNKGGITVISPWFEVSVAGNNPSLGYFSCGGRNVNVFSPYFTFGSLATGEDSVNLKASTDTLSSDGITMTTDAASGCSIEVNDVSNPTLGISVGSDASDNLIHGYFDSDKVVNNAAGRNNSFYPSGIGTPNKRHFISGGFRIVEEADAAGYDPNRYILDCDSSSAAGPITLFNNPNNKLLSNSGILEIHSNLDMRILSGGNLLLRPDDTAGKNAVVSTPSGTSDWEKGHIQLGSYHLWVDSTGDLRIKSGAPTSDTDGAVVGGQS